MKILCWLGFCYKSNSTKLCSESHSRRQWLSSGTIKTVTEKWICNNCGEPWWRSKTMGVCVPDDCFFDADKRMAWEIIFYKSLKKQPPEKGYGNCE